MVPRFPVSESWSIILHLAFFILLCFWCTKFHHFMDTRIGQGL